MKRPSSPFRFLLVRRMSAGLITLAAIEAICYFTGFQVAKITSESWEEDEEKRICPRIDHFVPTPSFCRRSSHGSETEGELHNS
jgi:hypothetical protein